MLGPKEVHVTILRVRGAVDSLSYYLLFFQRLHSPHTKQTNDEPSSARTLPWERIDRHESTVLKALRMYGAIDSSGWYNLVLCDAARVWGMDLQELVFSALSTTRPSDVQQRV
jgi:hypothetical protein